MNFDGKMISSAMKAFITCIVNFDGKMISSTMKTSITCIVNFMKFVNYKYCEFHEICEI